MGVTAFYAEIYKWLQCSKAGFQEGKAWRAFRERGFLSAILAGQGLGFQEGSQSHCEHSMRETQQPLARDGAEHRISAESKAKYLGPLFAGVSRPQGNQNVKGTVC